METAETKPTAADRGEKRTFDRIPRRRARGLLTLARWTYALYLRVNGWKPMLLPSPLKGGGMIRKWVKRLGPKRYALTMEEALQTESTLHRARINQEAQQ